jgi:antitoxin HicB
MSKKFEIDKYAFGIRYVEAEDGNRFFIEYPDLPGCISDGATPQEAIENGRDAVLSYLRSCEKHGDPIPKPGSAGQFRGEFRTRLPKSLHARLAARAVQEGVSLNTLVIAAIAESLGAKGVSANK